MAQGRRTNDATGYWTITAAWACAVVVILCVGGCRGASVAASTRHLPKETGFVQRSIVVDGVPTSVWVFVPQGYTPQRMYPAMLFLHGLFEGGNGMGDRANVLGAGVGPVIARAPARWPFITIFPQSTGTWNGPDRRRLAMAALAEVQREYMVDPERIILAGLSFGGLGVWEIAAENPHRFAALVPVSGIRPPEVADALAGTPAWIFASSGDPIVSSSNSVTMSREVQARGGRVRLTEFDGSQHDCWARAVDETELVPWMLAQRRSSLASGPGRAVGRLRGFHE